MNITFIPGLTFDEQIAAWMNGTEDEHRMARWVRDKAVSERELDEAFEKGRAEGVRVGYDDGYAEGYDKAYGGGYDKGFEDVREEGHMARWVSENAVVSARDLDEAFEIGRADGVQVGYDDGYSKGFDEGFDEGFDHGREQGRLDAEEKQQDD